VIGLLQTAPRIFIVSLFFYDLDDLDQDYEFTTIITLEEAMKKTFVQITATIAALLFTGTIVFAAGSSSKPATPKRPGVSDYNSGVKLMKKGDYQAAQAKFEAALSKAPNMAEAHNNLAYSLRKQGADNNEKALSHYNRAIALNGKLAEAYMYRGVLHMLMGNEEKALEDHRTLTKLNRKLADALQAAIASGEEPDGLDGLAARKW
jgi:tetratricopeptide (TPR) repeat protein